MASFRLCQAAGFTWTLFRVFCVQRDLFWCFPGVLGDLGSRLAILFVGFGLPWGLFTSRVLVPSGRWFAGLPVPWGWLARRLGGAVMSVHRHCSSDSAAGYARRVSGTMAVWRAFRLVGRSACRSVLLKGPLAGRAGDSLF